MSAAPEPTLRHLDDLVEATVAAPLTIGVISDTHIPSRARAIPPAALAALAGSDLILHAGDLTRLAVLEPLRAIAPVLAVYGNVDPWEVAHRLPRRVLVLAGRWRIGLVHGNEGEQRTTPERARAAFEAVDAVVFGHSHQPLCEPHDGVLLFNPGSLTDRRRSPYCACGRLRVTAAGIEGEIIPLPG
jgi:putative phosphoesterase